MHIIGFWIRLPHCGARYVLTQAPQSVRQKLPFHAASGLALYLQEFASWTACCSCSHFSGRSTAPHETYRLSISIAGSHDLFHALWIYVTGSVPWLVMATSTAVPWICVVVFRARWHHVLLSSIVILVSAGVFVVSSLELDGQNPMSWMICLFINGCMASVNHRCFEKEIRSTFRREAATRRKLGSMTEASALYLLEVERSLRMGELMRYSPILFLELDKDGVVQSASPAAADLLGLSQFQAIKKSFYRFVHPADRDMVRKEIGSLVGKSRNFLRITYRRLRLDGSEFYCESVAHTVERKGHDTIVFVIDRDCSYDSEKDRKTICTVPHLGGWSGPGSTSSAHDSLPAPVLTSARPSISAGPDACDAMRQVTQALYCNALQLAAPQQCLSTALSTLEGLISPSPGTSHDVSTEQVLANVGPIVAGVKLVLQQAQWLQSALETFVAGVQEEFDMAGGVTSAGLKALLQKGCTGVRQAPPEAKLDDKKRPPRSTTGELILLCPGLTGEDLPVTSIVQEVVSLLGLSFSGTLHSSPSLETVSGVWSRATQGGVQILPEVTLRVLAPDMQSIRTDRSWLRQLMCDSVIRMIEAQRHLPLVTQTVSDTGTDNMNLSLPQPTVILLVSPLASPDSPEDASAAPGVRITVALPVAATASSEEVQQALARARGRNPVQYVAGLRAAADRLNCAAAAVSVKDTPPRGVEVSETMLAHRWLTWWFDIRPMKEAGASELLQSEAKPKYLSVLIEQASPGQSAGTTVMSMSPAQETARVAHPSPNLTTGAVRPRTDRAATPPMSKPVSTPGQPTHAITPASKPKTTQVRCQLIDCMIYPFPMHPRAPPPSPSSHPE